MITALLPMFFEFLDMVFNKGFIMNTFKNISTLTTSQLQALETIEREMTRFCESVPHTDYGFEIELYIEGDYFSVTVNCDYTDKEDRAILSILDSRYFQFRIGKRGKIILYAGSRFDYDFGQVAGSLRAYCNLSFEAKPLKY